VALLFSLPFGWENLLWGFQIAFYCLLGLSVLAIGLLCSSRPWSWKWLGGCVAAACALFTMASGFLVCIAVLAVLALRVWRHRGDRREMAVHVPTIVVCLFLSLLGWLLKAPVPDHRVLHAHSITEFCAALARNLAWPNHHQPFLCLLSWFPFAVFVWRYVRKEIGDGAVAGFVLGLGCWALLQATALALSRGAVEREISSRYMDILAQGVLANGLGVLLIAAPGDGHSKGAGILRHACVLNLIVTAVGLAVLTVRDFRQDLPGRRDQYDAQTANVAAFVATDNPECLRGKPFPAMIPFPDPEFLIAVLRNPSIRKILPASLREPIHLRPLGEGDQPFGPNGFFPSGQNPPAGRVWGSYLVERGGDKNEGEFRAASTKRSALAFLQFEVTGYLGENDLSLTILDDTDHPVGAVVPSQPPREQWKKVFVHSPASDFTLLARDVSPRRWFAFAEPKEMGRLSLLARMLAHRGIYVLIAGLLTFGYYTLAGFFNTSGSRNGD
jgi:hypothetical protein